MFPNTPSVSRLALILTLAGTAVILAGPGCLHPPEDELTNGVVAGERPVAMEGTSAFFAGKIIAKVTLSRGVGRGLKKGHGDKGKVYTDYTNNKDKSLIGSPIPPVTLHLILTNTGNETVTVEMIDFISDLGNFALDPEKLEIPAGGTVEPTSMVSQLGVTADVIPFKVTLRLGKAKESQTVQVKVLSAPDSQPASK